MGVYSFDEQPIIKLDNAFYISNTEARTEPGKHWFLVCRCLGQVELFDALKAKTFQMLLLLKRYKTHIATNATALQPDSSSDCGLFCIYYALHRFMNPRLPMALLLNEIFVDDKEENIMRMKSFLSDMRKY